MVKSQRKYAAGGSLEPLTTEKPKKQIPREPLKPEPRPVVHEPKPLRLTPRPVQFNDGRLEIMVSYWVAVLAGMVVLLTILVAFRLGQYSVRPATADTKPAEKPNKIQAPEQGSNPADSELYEMRSDPVIRSPERPEREPEGVSRPVSNPDNRPGNAIQIMQTQFRKDLEPLKTFFDNNGIPTEIREINGSFRLFTQQRFEKNPSNVGTPGYELKQKIAEIGAEYRPPAGGYLPFRPEDFADAFGYRLTD